MLSNPKAIHFSLSLNPLSPRQLLFFVPMDKTPLHYSSTFKIEPIISFHPTILRGRGRAHGLGNYKGFS